MAKILITGANGLLGQELVKQLLLKKYKVIATSKGNNHAEFIHPYYKYYELDITNEKNWHDVLSAEKPNTIIHAGALTQVDECELNRDKCYEINYLGTVYGLNAAQKFCRHFIYISTDFVFDGTRGMYKEEDKCLPVNWYGECKLKAEEAVMNCKMPWAIVRTCLVYGNAADAKRTHFIGWVKDKLGAGEKIKVVDDQVRTPTYIGDLANGIIGIAEKTVKGVFHISGKDLMTPYQMAIETAHYLGLNDLLIERVNADTFTQPAKRPLKTGLNIDKAIKELGYAPMRFIDGLKKVLEGQIFL